MDTNQIKEDFQGLLLQTEEQRQREAEETETRLDEKHFKAAACANNWTDQTEKKEPISFIVALKHGAQTTKEVPPDSVKTYTDLTRVVELLYGNQEIICATYAYCTQIRTRQRCRENLREFVASFNRLITFGYLEAPLKFIIQFFLHIFTDGVRDGHLQDVLRMARNRNISDSLTHTLEFEATKLGPPNQ